MSTVAAITLAANNLFAPKIQDDRYLRTFNVRKKETRFIVFYATVEIANVRFFNARLTYVNINATVEIHFKASLIYAREIRYNYATVEVHLSKQK